MYFIDELTREETNFSKPRRVLTKIVNGIYVYGYTKSDADCIRVRSKHGFQADVLIGSPLMEEVIYSNRQGFYLFKEGMSKQDIMLETTNLGKGGFPYTFQRRYEAIESFKLFNERQKVLNPGKAHPISRYLRYTFGLEFETSAGYIPEHICFRDGLIPLRDGSIDGLEYSTVVMSENEGICLLEQQLQTLRKYTIFDKECSLHIHFGGYPLDTDKIFDLYRVCKRLEMEIQQLVPPLTFHSEQYKRTQKNYCGFLPPENKPGGRPYRSFKEMYFEMVGKEYKGDLTLPHPNDEGRERKWLITTRYYWVNFINMLCYGINKTVEFRLLRPSYNLEKISYWIYVFTAILTYAEKMEKNQDLKDLSLVKIFNSVFDKDTADNLCTETEKLRLLIKVQSEQNDQIGASIHLEDKMFNPDMCL